MFFRNRLGALEPALAPYHLGGLPSVLPADCRLELDHTRLLHRETGMSQAITGQATTGQAGNFMSAQGDSALGETITLTHSVSLPRPYSRDGRVQGTKGIWCEDTNGIYIEGISSSIVEIDPAGNPYTTHQWDPVERFYDAYEHPLWREYAKNTVGGHGGMDYLALRAFVESVQERKAPPIDVYDTASWMVCLLYTSYAADDLLCVDLGGGRFIKKKKNISVLSLSRP